MESDWDEALDLAAGKMKEAGNGLVTIASGRLSNEDLFNLRKLTEAQGGLFIGYSRMAGGDVVNRYGMLPGSNLGALGKGSVIVAAACDLHEEAPLWWLRVREAVKRGAQLILIQTRASRLDLSAARVIRVTNGGEIKAVDGLLTGDLADTLRQAENLVVFYGSDSLGREATGELALACARLLENSGHARKVNSGLIPAWERGNTQGLWDNGALPADGLMDRITGAKVLLIAGADPAVDDPEFDRALEKSEFVIVQELFKTATAQKADVVFPVLAFTEREGSYTSGERRVQRYYPAVPAPAGVKADYEIAAALGAKLGLTLESDAASLVFQKMAGDIQQYNGLTYMKLAETTEQFPIIGREDVITAVPRTPTSRAWVCSFLLFRLAGLTSSRGKMWSHWSRMPMNWQCILTPGCWMPE